VPKLPKIKASNHSFTNIQLIKHLTISEVKKMSDNSSRNRVLVIHGPNLNMLGQREPDIYGHQSLDEINGQLLALAEKLGMALEIFQSNHEGDIVDRIQQSVGACESILINPAALPIPALPSEMPCLCWISP
jgi:hypothetical protein